MELACLAAAGSDAAQLCHIMPVDDINRVVGKVGDVHAALLRNQAKVVPIAGKQVTIAGTLAGDTLKVDSVK